MPSQNVCTKAHSEFSILGDVGSDFVRYLFTTLRSTVQMQMIFSSLIFTTQLVTSYFFSRFINDSSFTKHLVPEL